MPDAPVAAGSKAALVPSAICGGSGPPAGRHISEAREAMEEAVRMRHRCTGASSYGRPAVREAG